RKIIELYGQGADEEIERTAKIIKQFKWFELEVKIEEYKKKLKDL
ncbi:unnamed protein product, partial [marine sediment metagenome]